MWLNALIPAAAEAVGSFVTNAYSDSQTSKRQDAQNRFNAEQAQIAYDRQRDFYNYQFQRESAYNSPAAQMQRYKAAGVNPYLAVSNQDAGNTSISATSPAAASAASVSQMQYDNPFGGLSSSLSSIINALTQENVGQSIAHKNRIEADKIAGVDTEEARSRILLNIKDAKLKESQISNVRASTKEMLYNLKEILPKQSQSLIASIAKIYNDVTQSQNLTRAQVAQMAASARELIASANLKSSEKQKVDVELKFLEDKLSRDLDIMTEQFHQLENLNQLQKTKNQAFDKVMYGKGYEIEPWLIKLRALSTINNILF